MPFVDDPNDNNDNTGVAGVNPLAQGAQQQNYDAAAEDNSQQAASAGTTDIQSSSSQSAGSNKKPAKASSGMFTNIQNYVAKNQPQAQKIAGAVTGGISNQASEIRKVSEEQQALQNKLLQSNQGLIDNARSSATSAVNQIVAPQTTPTAPAASVDDFKKYMSSNVGQSQVQDLNLSQQQLRSDALSQLAKSAETEQGRRDLLGQTFKKQGAYTRGMSGLDQLITSGDKTAREALIGGVRDTSGQLKSDINTIRSTQEGLVGDQRRKLDSFGNEIRSLAENPYTNLYNEANTRAEKFRDMDLGSTISDADLAATGLTREQVSNLYGVDPSVAFGSKGATAEQIARMSGLSSLLGQPAPEFQEFKTQDFLDQVAAQKALYETDPKNQAAETFKNMWGTHTGGQNRADELKKFEQAYEEGLDSPTYSLNPNPGGRSARTWNATLTDFYNKYKAKRQAAETPYRYGEGLKSEEGDKLVRDYTNTAPTGKRTGNLA